MKFSVEPRGKTIHIAIDFDRHDLLGHFQARPDEARRYLADELAGIQRELERVLTHLTDQGEEGEVKWFSDAKGYGWISVKDSADVFVHWKGIRGAGRNFKTLQDGQKVRFVRAQGKSSIEAVDVHPIEESK